MSLKQVIEADLKEALLGGDKLRVDTLRGLKAVILDSEVATGAREKGLDDPAIMNLITKEIKKRKESVSLYAANNRPELADSEQKEIDIIIQYLPKQLDETELSQMIDSTITEINARSLQDMGKVIGAVKAKAGSSADGAMIARLVKEKLS
jgi:Uncharacterized conserved protein